MAAQSNVGFQHQSMGSSALNKHALLVHSDAVNRSSEMSNYFAGRMMLQGDSSKVSNCSGVLQQPDNSAAAAPLRLNAVPGLTLDTGLAVEWSVEEQYRLEDGLAKYVNEPNIMKYVKIAASFRDKTVRDVALRCRWMARKRRKSDERVGKKMNTRKEKLVESSLKTTIASTCPLNTGTYSLMMPHIDQSEQTLSEVPGISGTTKYILEQNAQAFNQIAANLSSFKLQDNIDLFCHTRNNITAILNDMSNLPGMMCKMPPLPIPIDEGLANSILPNTNQSIIFGSPSGIHLKEEPRC